MPGASTPIRSSAGASADLRTRDGHAAHETGRLWRGHSLRVPARRRSSHHAVDDPGPVDHRRLLVASIVVAAVALGVRYWPHESMLDVFVDEFVYQGLGESVVDGGLPRFGRDDLFFLHPPGFFYVLAAWQQLTGAEFTDPIAAVFHGRVLNAVLGGVTAGLMVWLVGRRVLLWGVLAGLLFAVEPFALRQNGRVLLETAGMTWVLIGLVMLLPLTTGPLRRWRAIVGGLALGCAILTKDMLVMTTLAPLALAWFVQPRQRPWLPLALAATVTPYIAYVGVVTIAGHFGAWWETKIGGLMRALGAEVTTGFSAPGAPSLWGQIWRQLADFGATYVLLALGVAAAAWLLWGAAEDLALLALVHVGAFVLLAYSVTAGTIEEQFLYFLFVPTVLVVTGAGVDLSLQHRPESRLAGRPLEREPHRSQASPGGSTARAWRRRTRDAQSNPNFAVGSWSSHGGPVVGGVVGDEPPTGRTADLLRRAPALLAAALVLIIAVNTLTYLRWAQRDDDGFAQARSYLLDAAEPGTGVIIVNGTSEFALGDEFDVGPHTGEEDRREHDVRYLVVPWKEVFEGYTYVTLDTVEELVAEATLVFENEGPTYDRVSVYELPPV